MEYKKLGQTDIMVSRITHGCMELGGSSNPNVYWDVRDESYNIDLLHTALDNGITTFDTAESYGAGRSEEIVGKALKGVRKDCIIATKVSKTHLRANDIQAALEGSLRRLQTDYIDLYYIHWPNPDIPLEETMVKLAQLRQSGVIRSIGVSNFSAAQLREALQYAPLDAYQPEYNLLSRDIEAEIMPICCKHQISILSYNSLAKGLLTGAFHQHGAVLTPEDFRKDKPLFRKENMLLEQDLILCLREIAVNHGVSISQVAIRWALEQPAMASAIIGTQNTRHFTDNIQAFSLSLSTEELNIIRNASDRVIASLLE
ncbi:MAG: aldo/keto reductase [Clostridiales bacterium]|nr:aldo/keto reductase [Clostridiales bacterium]MDY4007721.1 aldo/keto reductase [Candidatus Limiplasma sp.]